MKGEEMKRTDCYYYDDVHDMNATIPTCDYYEELGYCPCEDCKIYISPQKIDKLVRKFINAIRKFINAIRRKHNE